MSFNWLAGEGLERLPLYLTALAIGLLIGLERERNPTAKAGLRTCALVALAGAMSAALAETFSAPAIIAVGLGAVALMMIAAYYHHHEAFHEWDPGTTTIAAVIGCYLLGAMTLAGFARLAVILGILVTVLLYFKAELGGVARKLERRDLVVEQDRGEDAEDHCEARKPRQGHGTEQVATDHRRDRGRARVPFVERRMMVVIGGDHHERNRAKTDSDDGWRGEGFGERRRHGAGERDQRESTQARLRRRIALALQPDEQADRQRRQILRQALQSLPGEPVEVHRSAQSLDGRALEEQRVGGDEQ